jgi:hypothetical protein
MTAGAKPDLEALVDGSLIDGILALAESSEKGAGATRVISIDGRSGAGKSTLAASLAQRAGAAIVSLDFLYGGWDGLRSGIERLCDQVLQPLADQRDALVPHFDWTSSSWGEPWLLAHGGLVVVEGVGAGSAGPAQWSSAIVWLEADEETRRDRALGRDGASFEPHWQDWASQELELFGSDPVAERCDLIIETG